MHADTGGATSPTSREVSIYRRQCKLRDQMLALPMPTAPGFRQLAEACSLAAEEMAVGFYAECLLEMPKILQMHRQGPTDQVRLQILEKMYKNFESVKGDPLAFWAAREIEIGESQAKGRSLADRFTMMMTVGLTLEGLKDMSRLPGWEADPITKKGTGQLEEFYAKSTEQVQARLLLAYFGSAEMRPVARHYLTKWFIDCDLKADYIVLDAYMNAFRAHARAWAFSGLTTDFLANSQMALNAMKNCGARTIFEAEEQSTRAAAGACILCGKPLGGVRKLFGAKKHSACTMFIN